MTSRLVSSQEMPFTIDYVVGSVSGEIYWEEMEVGGRVVHYQAMGASSLLPNSFGKGPADALLPFVGCFQPPRVRSKTRISLAANSRASSASRYRATRSFVHVLGEGCLPPDKARAD
jgi:hypothetical protein